MKALYSERNGFPTNKVKTDTIQKDIYKFILDCCDRYLINLAAAFPLRYGNSSRIWGVDDYRFHAAVKYRIPIFYEDNYRFFPISNRRFRPKYNQYALLDYVEFIVQNIRTISSIKEYNDGSTAYEFQESDDGLTAKAFRDEINEIFDLGGVLYTLTDDNIIERITTIDEQISIEASNIEAIKEPGIKDLIIESIELYKSPRPELHKLATEKIWDALERIKTIFVGEGLDKKQSVARLVGIMANGNEYYKTLFDSEFTELTNIGNKCRIRHHETDKIEIVDERYYDYFYSRCFALIALAIKYI